MEGYEFSRGLDHASIVAASERVAWTVDEVFRDRRFDASQPMVPASWVGTQGLGFLDHHEQRLLNHCRAFSYAHLLGNFEEFAPPHLGGIVQQDWHDDRAAAGVAPLRRRGDDWKGQQRRRNAVARLRRVACTERRSGAQRADSRLHHRGTKIAFVTRGHRAPEEPMERWLRNLVGPVYGIVDVFLEPMYGIVDLFLDRPFAAVVMTSALGGLIAAAVLSLR